MNNVLLTFLITMIAIPLQGITAEQKKNFQMRLRASIALRQQEFEQKRMHIPVASNEDFEQELRRLRAKIAQIPEISEEEPSILPAALLGSSALFLGANTLAMNPSSRFILETMAAGTVIKLGAAVGLTSYGIYKIRQFMRNDEGEKKLKKEFKEGITAWVREFNAKIGKAHEDQEIFNAAIRKDFEDLKAEMRSTYKQRKQKLKDQLDSGFSDIGKKLAAEIAALNKKIDTHNKDIDAQNKIIKTGLKQVDDKLKEKKDINAEHLTRLAKERDDLLARLAKEREEQRREMDAAIKERLAALEAERKELKAEKKELKDLLEHFKAALAEQSAQRALQAKEIAQLRELLNAIGRGKYKAFITEITKAQEAFTEQPKQSFMDRFRGRHSRNNSIQGGGTSSPAPTSDNPRSSLTDARGRRVSLGGTSLRPPTIDTNELSSLYNQSQEGEQGDGKEGAEG